MKKTGLIILSTLALAACGSNVKESLGLERTTPDEFQVVERAPLVVPPNFNLVPPTPGAQQPQAQITDPQDLVLGSQLSAPKANALSRGESALLKKAGTADPMIRAQINAEGDPTVPKNTAEKLGIIAPSSDPKVLNATDEAARLKQQKSKTSSPATAKTPVKK